MVWCGTCYEKGESDKFQVNKLLDEDGVEMYDCESDRDRYNKGVDGAHVIIPFQCNICIFRTLWKRDPREEAGDNENLVVLRRMNLDAIWAREPSTIKANLRVLNRLIVTCESSGFQPQLPALGPFPAQDDLGYTVAFSMLMHSLRPGKHSNMYTQFATIWKQRSAFSNLYMASKQGVESDSFLSLGSQPTGFMTKCSTNSHWFARWSSGCQARMGYIVKQNKAISVYVLLAIINKFHERIEEAENLSWEKHRLCLGLCYSVITFFASLRGSEGLNLDLETTKRDIDKGKLTLGDLKRHKQTPHVVVAIKGRFKGETGERCHLLALASKTKSGVNIRAYVELLIGVREEMKVSCPWGFVNKHGSKMSFQEMNDIVMECLEMIKDEDEESNVLGLKDLQIREDFSVNRSFRRGSSTHATNSNVPEPVIEAQNRWRKIENAKGRRPGFSMIETYADIEQLIPTVVQYQAMS
jgi:hypothetical protein